MKFIILNIYPGTDEPRRVAAAETFAEAEKIVRELRKKSFVTCWIANL